VVDFIPKSRATCIASDDEQRYIVLHRDKPVWTVVNEVGYKILSLCDGHSSVGQISHVLSQWYGVPLEPVLSDVQSFIIRLGKEGFLFSPDPAQPVSEPSEENFILKKVDLYITENCNLRCRHCAVAAKSKKTDYLTTEQIFKIIDEAKELGIGSVNISGGEPLLREDCLAILSYAAQRVKVAVATNGTLINDYTAQVLADLNLKIQISLDGPQASIHDFIRGKGSFDRTINALDLLGNLGVKEKITFCSTVSKNNLSSIPELLNLAIEKGIPEIRFIPLQNMGTARSYWSDLAPSMEDYTQFYSYAFQEVIGKFPELRIMPGFQGFMLHRPPGQVSWCPIGQILTIDAQGDLYPCSLLMEPSFKLGNILKVSLQQAIESPRMREIREICLLRKSTIPECRVCPWKNFCQGGCPGSVYQLKGTLQAVDDLCEFRKKFYSQTIFRRADRKSRSFSNTLPGGDEEDSCA